MVTAKFNQPYSYTLTTYVINKRCLHALPLLLLDSYRYSLGGHHKDMQLCAFSVFFVAFSTTQEEQVKIFEFEFGFKLYVV